MKGQRWAVAGGAVMSLAVVFGAFGAHALKARLDVGALAWWQTASQYHMVHGLGLLAMQRSGRLPAPGLAAQTLFKRYVEQLVNRCAGDTLADVPADADGSEAAALAQVDLFDQIPKIEPRKEPRVEPHVA